MKTMMTYSNRNKNQSCIHPTSRAFRKKKVSLMGPSTLLMAHAMIALMIHLISQDHVHSRMNSVFVQSFVNHHHRHHHHRHLERNLFSRVMRDLPSFPGYVTYYILHAFVNILFGMVYSCTHILISSLNII